MAEQLQPVKQELELGEHLAGLWAHKIFICLFTSLSVFLSAYLYISKEKQFTSTAVFEISNDNQSSFDLSSELGTLATIAGFGQPSSSSSMILLERIMGREFILAANKQLKFNQDRFFNPYNPEAREAVWKSTIKKIIGLTPIKKDETAIIENYIVNSYRSFIYAAITEAGAFSISVTHKDAEMAAKYANGLMEKTRQFVEIENKSSLEQRLTYLSETLADALQDMDKAQQNLKNFTLENSAMARENFISGSLKLDELRMERRKVEEISKVLSVIGNLIETKNLNDNSYRGLRSNYPLVDDVDFRRILGMSETISAWSWPNNSTVKAVSATLSDRIKRLNIEIKSIEENAKIYATSAEELSKFKRDAKIAEATYAVLIEQVKSQSLAAGFRPESFKVFEYATASPNPSSPNRNLYLGLGFVLGFFLSCAIAKLNCMRRGVYYTKDTIINDTKTNVVLKTNSFKRLTRRSVSKMSSYLTNHRILEIDEAQIKLSNSKLIYVLSCGGRTTASGTARLLASHSSHYGKKSVLFDKTGQSELNLEDNQTQISSGLPTIKVGTTMNLLVTRNENIALTSEKFRETIEKLQTMYEQVYVCVENSEAILGLMALKDFNPTIILLARLRKTKKVDIKKINSNNQIDILFYD